MAYAKGVVGGVIYCGIFVQLDCTIVRNASGGRQYQDDWFVHNSLKVNEYFVKAKC